jgi:hypothetical protein
MSTESPALGSVREAWLFTRGAQSVRIVRASGVDTRMMLHVHGPDAMANSHTFDDVITCMRYQADFERRLVGEGFSLERFVTERRTGLDRRTAARGFDRRQLVLMAPPAEA